MSPIKKLPDLDWNEIARMEISMSGEELVEHSACAYLVRNVAAAGLIYQSFVGPPWFWFILARGVTMRDLIDFRRLQERIPLGAITAINDDLPIARRFAEFYGFQATDKTAKLGGHTYRIYRRA